MIIKNKKTRSKLILWLVSIAILLVIMICVGGITRLTQSGLSIVEWQPIMGTIPPISEADWLETFQKYMKTPEFLLKNSQMTLIEFKSIFFWEYVHRVIGRLIGIVFLVPWVIFLLTKQMTKGFAGKSLIGFFLGGLQGALGWYMVKSGLIDKPFVSHYRLAAHLMLAFSILAYFAWLILEVVYSELEVSLSSTQTVQLNVLKKEVLTYEQKIGKFMLWMLTGVVVLQIFYGALTAGLKAGYLMNTFPLMYGHILPPGIGELTHSIENFFENPVVVQTCHRFLAWSILLILFIFANRVLRSKASLSTSQRKSVVSLIVVVSTQFLLGVFTLVFVVPVSLATFHQVVASILVVNLIWCHYVWSHARP